MEDNRFKECIKDTALEELSQEISARNARVLSMPNAVTSVWKKAKCHSFYWHINYARKSLYAPLASTKGINPSSQSACDSAFALSTENCKLRGNNVEMRKSTKPWHVNTIQTRVKFARIIKSTQLVWRRPATKKQLQGLEAWTGVVEEGIKDENGTYSELIYGVDAIFEAENWMCSPEVIHCFHKKISKSWVAVQI